MTITRDPFGIPHVVGDTREAMAFGAGYALATDRLFETDVIRRLAQGRLSEILGAGDNDATLIADETMRREFYDAADIDAQYNALPVDIRRMLQAFADAGVRDQPVDNLLGNNNAPFEPARTSFDWLSRDGDEVDRYIADPMCGDDNPLTYGYLIDLFDVVAPARDQLASIRCPVLVIAGDHDPAAAMGVHATTLAHALEAEGVDVDVALYEGARHELLNEINRDQVTTDIIGWLQSRA